MRKLSGTGFIFLLFGIIIVASSMMVNGFSPINDKRSGTQSGIAVKPPPSNSHSNIQLKTFPFATLTIQPTISTPQPTGGTCAVDNAKTNGCVCVANEHDGVVCDNKINGVCPDNNSYGVFSCDFWPPSLQQSWGCTSKSCLYINGVTDTYIKYKDCKPGHDICWGKPVIYLYPAQKTFVTVKLNIPGKITKSDPVYTSGWNNVLANPDGKLIYNNKHYHELFYETEVSIKPTLSEGAFIEKNELERKLTIITTKIGLIPKEQQEFLNYWLPKLEVQNSKYIFVSILPSLEKDKVDHVSISPKPDTLLSYLFYFKATNKLYKVKALSLPDNPPKRVGFTAVEWGGTINN